MALNLTQIATDLISQAGYSGLSLGLFVDSFGIPIPSEILVPLGTVLALDGRFSLVGIFLLGTLAQVAGGTAGYFIGRYGGEPILEKYGKYVLISHRDLKRTHQAFEKWGIWLTMAGRCIPGIRGLIAYPAGIAEMPLGTFLLFTTIGSAVWTGFLMYLGTLVGKNMALMDQIAGKFSLAGIALVLAFLAWHFRHLWWRRGRD